MVLIESEITSLPIGNLHGLGTNRGIPTRLANDERPLEKAHGIHVRSRTRSRSTAVIERHRQRRNRVEFKRYYCECAWRKDGGYWNRPEEDSQKKSQGHSSHRVPREEHQGVVEDPEKVVDCCDFDKALSKGVPGLRLQQAETISYVAGSR
jgi:hypothetical protein